MPWLWIWSLMPRMDGDPYTLAGSKPGGTGEGKGRS